MKILVYKKVDTHHYFTEDGTLISEPRKCVMSVIKLLWELVVVKKINPSDIMGLLVKEYGTLSPVNAKGITIMRYDGALEHQGVLDFADEETKAVKALEAPKSNGLTKKEKEEKDRIIAECEEALGGA